MRVMKARDLDPASPLVCFCESLHAIRSFWSASADVPSFSLADLPWLKVATVSEVPTPWLCLQHDLRERGVDPGRINRVADRTMGDNLTALRKGELDVAQMFEPYASMACGRAPATSSMLRAAAGQPSIRHSWRRAIAFAATVRRSLPWSAPRAARLIGSPSIARWNWRMRSRHSTRTCR